MPSPIDVDSLQIYGDRAQDRVIVRIPSGGIAEGKRSLSLDDARDLGKRLIRLARDSELREPTDCDHPDVHTFSGQADAGHCFACFKVVERVGDGGWALRGKGG